MYNGVNADAIKPAQATPSPMTYSDKLTRAIEDALPCLLPNEMARIRVAMVAVIREKQRIAWNEGAEWADRQAWIEHYGTSYPGHIEPRDNPYRTMESM